jgi:hypothetical protein
MGVPRIRVPQLPEEHVGVVGGTVTMIKVFDPDTTAL